MQGQHDFSIEEAEPLQKDQVHGFQVRIMHIEHADSLSAAKATELKQGRRQMKQETKGARKGAAFHMRAPHLQVQPLNTGRECVTGFWRPGQFQSQGLSQTFPGVLKFHDQVSDGLIHAPCQFEGPGQNEAVPSSPRRCGVALRFHRNLVKYLKASSRNWPEA
jgi:hypothetical protein